MLLMRVAHKWQVEESVRGESLVEMGRIGAGLVHDDDPSMRSAGS